MAQQSVPLTAAGIARLEDELEQMKIRRQELLQRIQDETESGDVSDNSEYEELKEQAAIADARIAELETTLSNAVVIQPTSDGTVGLGSRVTIRDEEGVEETWVLVRHEEANTLEGSISTDSPVGRALLGRREGDVAEVQTPAGSMSMAVVKVG